MKHFCGLLVVAFTLTQFPCASHAQALRLQPLATFGPNGDGTLRPGDLWFLTGDGGRYQRGMAYNPVTGHLLVVNRYPIGSETINVADALTGVEASQLDQSSRSIGGSSDFAYNLVGVADDGAIYVGNLTTSGTLVEFLLYRWANETAPQTLVYGPANPGGAAAGNTRWGDALAVRGSGINTEVLICNRGFLAAILKPTDATLSSFTATTLTATTPSVPFGYALAFGPGNTFYTKSASSEGAPLYRMSYDLGAGTATLLSSYEPTAFPGRVGALMVQPASNLLAAVDFNPGTNADYVCLYSIADTANAPVFQHRRTLTTWTNANDVFAGAVAFAPGRVYALNSDNGIAAFTVESGTEDLAPYIYGPPVGRVVQVTSNVVMAVGADGSPPLSYQWQFNGSDLPGMTTNRLEFAKVARADQGDYSVVVTNAFGAVTSSVATLTVLENYGNLLVYEPFNYPVGVSFLGQGGWIRGSGSTGGDFVPEAGNLDVPYLSPSIGNRLVIAVNGSPRKPIGTYSQGVLYFSAALRIEAITLSSTLPSNETTLGFANGTSTTYPLKINIGCSDDTLQYYHIGLYKGGGTGNGAVATNLDGSTRLYTTNDTVFIVGRYQFNSGVNDDIISLWINPPPASFGAATPPPPTLTDIGAGATDATVLDHFVLRRSGGFPRRIIDEARVGFAWSEVTPPVPPVLAVVSSGTSVVLSWSTNIPPGFALESQKGFSDPDGWRPVNTPVVVQGDHNTVTVPAVGTALFRLKQ